MTRRFEDVLTKEQKGSPYEFKQMLTTEGWRARRRSRKRFRLLKAVDPRLIRILQPGERVHFLTHGSPLSTTEGFFTDWAAYFLNRRALVFTNVRLLLIQINVRKHPLDLVSQIAYSAIAGVEATPKGYCRLALRDGRQLDFTYMPRADRKFLHTLLTDLVKLPCPAGAPEATGAENLCPQCFSVVKDFPRKCPECGVALKSSLVAGILSFLFPGWGNWYLGFKGFAVVELLGAAYLWLTLVLWPLFHLLLGRGVPHTRRYWILIALGLVVLHGLDAAMTRHYARKGLHARSD